MFDILFHQNSSFYYPGYYGVGYYRCSQMEYDTESHHAAPIRG